MIRSFRAAGTEDNLQRCQYEAGGKSISLDDLEGGPPQLELLDSARTLEDLSVPRANYLEALRKNRAGQHSIRINAQYRVCFVWTGEGPTDVEIVDYHD